MDNSQLTVLALLNHMFPGTEEFPGFLDLVNKDELALSVKSIKEVALIYRAIQDQNYNLDINETIKLMKLDKTVDTVGFVNSALEVYFSQPEVISKLTGSPVPLFPNERILADVDYDLLEPVYKRINSE